MGFVGMRMPGRELLRSRFQLGQARLPQLGAAQTNRSQQVAAVIREGRGKEEKERISKQNPKHKLESIEANQLCHAAQDTCPHFDQPAPPRAPLPGLGDRASKALPEQEHVWFHPQPSPLAALTFQPARKGAQ